MRARVGAGLLALTTGLAAALQAGAALSSVRSPPALPTPSLTITPSIIDAIAVRGAFLTPIRVVNSTPVVFKVRFYPALVHQKLDGSLVIRERRRELAAAKKLFAIRPTSREMTTGAALALQVRFLRPPPRRRAAYAAAVVEATPSVIGPGTSYRLRLLGALLVRTPRAPAPHGRIASMRVMQLGPRRFAFCARLANTGRVHGYPGGLRLQLRRKGGAVVASGAPRPGVVLPGYRRDYGIRLFHSLPRGEYVLDATGRFGRSTLRARGRFSVIRGKRVRVSRTARLGCAA
jgi:hypothetical protein